VAGPETNERRRISVELPDSLVRRLDELKDEWGLRARGDCLSRLLEEIFSSEDELDNELDHDPVNDEQESSSQTELPTGVEQSSSSSSSQHRIDSAPDLVSNDPVGPSYSEDRALVLIGRGALDVGDRRDDVPQDNIAAETKTKNKSAGGINLPGFVQKRTSEIRESLKPKPKDTQNADSPLLPSIDATVLESCSQAVSDHWLNLYGKPAGDTVLEAAMTWLARDIWPNADGTEGRTFTWSQAGVMINSLCPGWVEPSPRFEQVMVVAGVLEDPFATSELKHRLPTLIRRFVNRFKRSRKVTSFETLESTMTVHGALKLLGLPTQAGASLTLKIIRDAYKQQAMDTHPDAGGSTEAMRRLNEAYQMLRELYRQKS